ncbi:class I SAM-dependent methyltransferase [Marinobacter sp. tcs-11]|jgi:SAM-dependent methyltransferase|uniref:class I SAM-dependent methyltransferase n=1 Tax=Marinobacter sp. tcs-11 TaxID=1742860 RepID=UPI00257B3E6A|nr:class I SAM-dependent methyltransferase [Marinobacter sp. tcs-11]
MGSDFYEKQAERFFQDTVAVDMQPLYQRFLQHVPQGEPILDAGCGSGRDALAFKRLGYSVHAFDASTALATMASELLGQPVDVLRFENFICGVQYAGIWACASLLHVSEAELPDVFVKLWQALLPDGVLYCSFKYGDTARCTGGRHFTDANEERLERWTNGLPGRASQSTGSPRIGALSVLSSG